MLWEGTDNVLARLTALICMWQADSSCQLAATGTAAAQDNVADVSQDIDWLKWTGAAVLFVEALIVSAAVLLCSRSTASPDAYAPVCYKALKDTQACIHAVFDSFPGSRPVNGSPTSNCKDVYMLFAWSPA